MSKQAADTGFRPGRNSYTREDGAVMVEVRPGVFVNEQVASAAPPTEEERARARRVRDRTRDLARGRRGRL